MATIRQIIPMLIAEDLDATIKYYCEKLGFEINFIITEGIDPYASVYRDGTLINFSQGTLPPEPSCYGGIAVQVDDVDELYEELKQRGALSKDFPKHYSCIREHPPEDKEYGLRDMFLVDPNGYIIHFLTPLTNEV